MNIIKETTTSSLDSYA